MKFKLKKIDAVIIIIMLVIAGVVLFRVGYIEPEKEHVPTIQLIQDDENNILTVLSVSERVLWEDIFVDGSCDISELGENVNQGDRITECRGTIVIVHKPTGVELSTWVFSPIPRLPSSLIPGNMRDVSPEDEGVHFDSILNDREWWYWTVVFSKDSELPGWAATIGFCHLAWGDLRGTFKPDMLVVTLHSPDGKEYGGMINKERGGVLGLGLFGDNTLEASTPGVDVEYEDSWARGEAPIWHVHAEDNDIDEENEIVIDLDYFAPSPAYWTQSTRLVDKGEGCAASYVFFGCEVSGTVKLDGLEFKVEGIGSHEHSWSPGILKVLIKGWDWCHMTLDNGWNIYYSKYYLSRQIVSTGTSKVNPISSLIITTDQGETLTPLENIDIIIKESDKLFLLLEMPTELGIIAKPKTLNQPLLKSLDIYLNIDILTDNTYEKTWKFPTYIGMKVGLNAVSGKIKWSDDDGDHEIELNGLGTIWHMRRF